MPATVDRNVANAVGFGAKPAKLTIISFKLMRKNTLVGFATVELASGLRLIDCPVHRHANGREWVGLPARPVLDDQGRHKPDPATGKPSYAPVAEWRDRGTADRFSEIVVDLVRARYPEAFAAEDPR